MNGMHTIGQLAKQAGVPISTVRYYERRGLLEPEGRTASRYRLYGSDALHRLRFIRAAQTSGLTLKDASRLLALRDGHTDPCGEAQELVGSRLEAIEIELTRLRRVRGVLRETLSGCRKPHAKGGCEAIARLDEQAAKASGPKR